MVLPLIARGALAAGAKYLSKKGATEAVKGVAKKAARSMGKAPKNKLKDRPDQTIEIPGRPKPINSTFTPKPTMRRKAEDMARKAAPIAGAAATAGAAADITSDIVNAKGTNAGTVRSGQYAKDKAAAKPAPAKAAPAKAAPAKAAKPAPAKSSRPAPITATSPKTGETFTPNPRSRSTMTGKVQTKGGEYKTYKKNSAMAQSFRSKFAAAKEGEIFDWNGKKYVKKTK